MAEIGSFVVLRSLETKEIFWTTHTGHNPERTCSGMIAYEVIAYVDSPEEAKRIWSENSPFGKLTEHWEEKVNKSVH